MKIRRKVLNPRGGGTMSVAEVLVLDVKAGWKSGTKLTYPEKGVPTVHRT